jgi:hypothetical protein
MPTQKEHATASQQPQQSARSTRRGRRLWFDPRFAIGLLLIVASVVGVVALVDSANASTEVLAARSTLTPGQKVHASDLVPTSVRVGRTAALYLRATDVPPAGLIVTRAVHAGELVAHSAVGSEAGRSLTSIVVSTSAPLPASVQPGARVDLWSSQPAHPSGDSADDAQSHGAAETGGFAAPTVLVSSAIVVRLVDQKNLVANSGSSIELLVPRSDTAIVLDAIANGAVLTVLPVDLLLEH